MFEIPEVSHPVKEQRELCCSSDCKKILKSTGQTLKEDHE